MVKGDKITIYFDCFGVVSEEDAIVRNIDRNGITLEDCYFNNNGGEEYYLFSLETGKCYNEPKNAFGRKRLKVN